MPWKRAVLADWDEGAIGDSDTTKAIKLPQALISSIHLRLSGTGGSGTPAVDNLIATAKVKTEKGYIFDMRSEDMHLLARAISGRKPDITNATSAYSATNHFIYFGRKPRDKALMLDLRNSNVRLLELTFGTLIATTAFATGTVKLTVTIDEWVGNPPPQYKGFMSCKEVENKATGTGKAVFELFSGNKLMGLFINIGTITTIRQVTISDKRESVVFGKVNFRDLVAEHNHYFRPDTAETVNALWALWDNSDNFDTLLPVLSMADPVCSIERGSTTSTSRVVQLDLVQ